MQKHTIIIIIIIIMIIYIIIIIIIIWKLSDSDTQRGASDLRKILEELDGHVEKSAVLRDARLEPRVDAHQFVDDLIALSLRVALHRQHLGRLHQRLDLLLGFLADAQRTNHLRLLRENFTQQTQAPANWNARSKQWQP